MSFIWDTDHIKIKNRMMRTTPSSRLRTKYGEPSGRTPTMSVGATRKRAMGKSVPTIMAKPIKIFSSLSDETWSSTHLSNREGSVSTLSSSSKNWAE